jgi:hypothetical protein
VDLRPEQAVINERQNILKRIARLAVKLARVIAAEAKADFELERRDQRQDD